MAMNKDILGAALKTALDEFNNKNPTELGDIDAARLAFCKALANEVIEHIKSAALITLVPAGLTAGANPVVGTATSTIV